MSQTPVRKKKHHQYSSLLLRKGVVVAVRKSGAGFAHRTGEQGAPLTPVPTWKLYENPSYQTCAAATAGRAAAVTGLMEGEDDEDEENNEEEEEEEEKMWAQTSSIKEVDHKETATHIPFISARKLAASLWEELQDYGEDDAHSTICDFSESSPRSHLQRRPSSLSTSESPDSVNHHLSFKAPTRSQQISRNLQPPTSLSPPLKAIMLMEPSAAGIASRPQGSAPKASNSQGKDAREELVELPNKYEDSDITYSCDSIEASCRSQALERTPQVDTSCSYLELPFSEELKRALSKVQQVEAAQVLARKEVDGLLRRCADEILMLRTREQEKIQAAVLSIVEQLEKERKVKKNVEMENRRLASSLADANKAVSAAKEELEKERKARQLMEDVCDELAKEIGEDKTEAEELKRELAKVRDGIEEERKTFQVTEAWREERVQMKLSEARLELEERCVALDNLKMELELFLERGKARRVEACLDHGGEILRGAVKKLQEDTCESLIFQKDAEGLLSPCNDATSSDNSHSRRNSWSSDEDGSIMRLSMYDNNGLHQILYSPELAQNIYGWNIESDRLAREDYNGLVSTKAHLEKHDKHWISCMRASKAGMKSHGSKARGLNSLVDRGLTRYSFNDDLEHRSRAGSDHSRIGGDYSSECGSSNEEDTDFDYVNGHLRQRNLASHSASELEEESGWKFSPKFSRKVTTDRSLEMMNVKRRQGGARVKQHHGRNGRKRAEHSYNGDSHRKYVCSQAKCHTLFTEDDNGFSSLTGYSPVYKGHLPSPDLSAQQGMNRTQKASNQNKHSALLGMKAVYNSVDWSKPYKRNSLQAKLLLEDGLSGGDFKLVH